MNRYLQFFIRGGLSFFTVVTVSLFAVGLTSTRAETFVGSNVDSRVILAFQVNEEAAQAWLPDGWIIASFPKGPLAGANLLVVLVDRHLSRDAEGKPTTPSSYRGVALVSPGSQEGPDETRAFVTRIYATPPGYDPYRNAISARIGRSANHEASDNAASVRTEKWTVNPVSGGEMAFSLTYKSGTPSWSEGQALPYSNIDPDFHRIYRYDQLVDLVMSVPAGKQLAGGSEFNTTIPEIAPMFDGNETLIGIISVPTYVRQVFLP
jgi:hypothetical protein